MDMVCPVDKSKMERNQIYNSFISYAFIFPIHMENARTYMHNING